MDLTLPVLLSRHDQTVTPSEQGWVVVPAAFPRLLHRLACGRHSQSVNQRKLTVLSRIVVSPPPEYKTHANRAS